MSILGALKQHSNSIDDLAKLPQAMIMQMAQKKEISSDMVAPILSRKAEMMDAVARTKALQQPEGTPSVLEQLMAKNTQAESPMQAPMPQSPAEIGVGQIPVPARQYAGGGIVAFKQGDLVDLEDDMDEEDLIAEYADAMQAGELAMQGNAGTGIKYSDPMPSGASKGIAYKGGNHPYESMVMAKAKEHGVDPQLASYILNKETGGLKNPENAVSPAGAMGIAQFMPATAKQYGINPNIPEEAAMGMSKHLRHLMDKYDDPKVAAIAYNWGEGNTNKWLKAGANMDKLPKETRKYVANLAQGGEVKHFANEGYVGFGEELPYDPSQSWNIVDSLKGAFKRNTLGTPEYFEKEASKGYKPKNKKISKEELAASQEADNEIISAPSKTAYIPNANPNMDNRDAGERQAAPMATPQAKTPEESYWDKVMKQMGQERTDLAKQKTEDRNMALLAAGLGMMGGTSSNAFTNIGQGGLSGMSYLADANKQRAAQSAALSKNELVAQRYKELGETAKGNQSGLMALKAGELAVHQGTLANEQQKVLENSLERMSKSAEASANAWIKANPMAGFSLENAGDVAQIKQQLLAKDPRYQSVYRQLEGTDFVVPNMGTAGGGTLAEQAAAALKAKKDKEKK